MDLHDVTPELQCGRIFDAEAPRLICNVVVPSLQLYGAVREDALIVRAVPGVQKAVKWNSPLYGVAGQGWFLGFHVFTRYVKVSFFRGSALTPLPPGTSKSPEVRYLDLHEHDLLDEAQLASWVKQAAALPGWVP